jgi:hypothetical protein
MPFINTIEAASSGGSDWDTYKVSEAFDPGFDTSSAQGVGSADKSSALVPISGYTGTYPYTCGYQSAHKTRWYWNALPASAVLRDRGALQGGYVNPASNYTFPPYMAIWTFVRQKYGQYSNVNLKGWRVMKLESTVGAFSSASGTYTIPQYSIDGHPNGMSNYAVVASVALSDYDGNAANWRDYDGMGSVVQQVRYVWDSSGSLTKTTPIETKRVLTTQGWAGDTWSSPARPRVFMGSEAANYPDAAAGTPTASSSSITFQYPSGTSQEKSTATHNYFRRWPWYMVPTSTATSATGYPAYATGCAGNGSQGSGYMNCNSPSGFGVNSSQWDLYIYDAKPIAI